MEKNKLNFLDKIMTIITFAEAGEAKTAQALLGQLGGKKMVQQDKRIEQRPVSQF